MALIVEDGTMPANANSWATLAFIRAYALDRGIDLSTLSDAALTAFAIKAVDWLCTQEFVGQPTTTTQSLPWPRQGVVNFDGSDWLSSGVGSIPIPLQNAEAQLCIEQNNGVDLLPTIDNNTTGGFVVRKKIDVLEKQFSERIGTGKQPIMPKVDRWLQGLLAMRPGGLRVVRV